MVSVTRGYQSTNNPQLVAERVPRREFVRAFGEDYVPGQHVSLFGPTGRGKSRLCFQLLGEVIAPDHPVYSLHGKVKGRDPVVMSVAKKYHLRMVPELPSKARQNLDTRRKYNGYLIMPIESPTTPAEETAKLHKAFEHAISQNYRTVSHNTITHINEAHQVQAELKLKEDVEAPLMRGGPDNAVWQEAQRGRYLSYHTYSAPEHIFVFLDPDADNRKRYSDFGVMDPRELYYLSTNLRTQRVRDGRTISECLYIRRGSGDVYVVGT
jgi:hypothetical protein